MRKSSLRSSLYPNHSHTHYSLEYYLLTPDDLSKVSILRSTQEEHHGAISVL